MLGLALRYNIEGGRVVLLAHGQLQHNEVAEAFSVHNAALKRFFTPPLLFYNTIHYHIFDSFGLLKLQFT